MIERTNINLAFAFVLLLSSLGVSLAVAQQTQPHAPSSRPQGPCDIYAAAGDPCVAAHSTTRALYYSYNGPLYQVLRQSDGKNLNIGVVQPSVSPVADPGGYADAAAQDVFCANTYCWITKIYDQSPKHNDLIRIKRQIELALAPLVPPIAEQIAKFMFSDVFLRLHMLPQNWMGPTAPNQFRTLVGSSSSI